MTQNIYQVSEITSLGILKSNPPGLYVAAEGTTNTLGWSNLSLNPRVYVDPPLDGIQDFDFVGDPPAGIAAQALESVSASCTMKLPEWAVGVRVHSINDAIVRTFGPICTPLYDVDLVDLEAVPPSDFSLMTAGDTKSLNPDEIEFYEVVDEWPQHDALSVTDNCFENVLLSIGGWPETKTVMKNKCLVSIGGKCKLKTKVPVIYHRTSKLQFITKVCVPTENDLKTVIENCLKEAVAAGVLAGIVSGNVAAFAAALKSYLYACLTRKGVKEAEKISLRITEMKKKGPWKRV